MQRKIYRNRINKEYAKKKKVCAFIALAITVVFLTIIFLLIIFDVGDASVGFIVIMLIALSVLQVVTSICPHCGKIIYRQLFWDKYCPHCGTTLEYSKALDRLDAAGYADTDEE